MGHTVGQVAALTGVTVRTLHHYDRIGLLMPSDRSEGGYRVYDAADLERLHEILSYRELGLSLEAIGTLLDEPAVDPVEHLGRQEALLRDRIARLERMLEAVTTMKEAHDVGINLTAEERFELFGDFDVERHAAEAEQRWGDTDAWRDSQRRAKSYTKDDWRRIRDEAEAVEAGLAAALADGEPAAGERAMDLAERARQHVDRWFYACTPEMHRRLAELYVSDPRFAAHYDRRAAGLARYVHDAVTANAERQEAR